MTDSTRSSKLERAWGRTIGFLLFGALCGFVAYATAKPRGEVWVTIVAGILAFGSLWEIVMGCHRVKCFACGRKLRRFYSFGYVRCRWCGVYGKRRGGEIQELEKDHVASSAEFLIPVGGKLSMPSQCCVCMGPATRTETVSRELTHRTGAVMADLVRHSVEVPHCDEHKSGAELTTENRSTEGPPEMVLVLKVCSYAFYRELLSRNPGRLQELYPPKSGI